MTEEQKQNMVGILQLGCERWTAAKFAGVMRDELEKALAADEAFALELGKAEAVAELKHMKVVHEAAQDPENWRSSAWWLEQRTRQREGGDDPTLAQVMELVDALSEIIMAEIKDDALQKRVIVRLKEIVYGREESPQMTQVFQIDQDESCQLLAVSLRPEDDTAELTDLTDREWTDQGGGERTG